MKLGPKLNTFINSTKAWYPFTGLPAFGGAVGDQGSKFTVQGYLSCVEPGIYALKLNIRNAFNRCHEQLTLHFGSRLFRLVVNLQPLNLEP